MQSLPKSLLVYSAAIDAASQPAVNPSEKLPGLPAVVLDTNAVLDWLLFKDAGMAPLAEAIETCALRWLATARMRQELLRTLAYPALNKWKPNSEHTLASFDRWAFICPEPEPARSGALVCSDPDDQVFIDLALARHARWLVSHDRALHKLARHAARAGVCVVLPKDWRAP